MTSEIGKRANLSADSIVHVNVPPRRAALNTHASSLQLCLPTKSSTKNYGRDSAVSSFLSHPPKSRLHRLARILCLEKKALFLIFVGTVASSMIALAQPMMAGLTIGALQIGGFTAALPHGLLLAVLAIMGSAITAFVNIVSSRAGNKSVRAFRDESAAISLRIPAEKLVQHPTADLVARCSIDSEHLSKVFTGGPVQALGSTVILLGALVQMLLIDRVLTFTAVSLSVVCLLFIVLISNRLTRFSYAKQEAQSSYVTEVTRLLDSILTLRAFVADKFVAHRLADSSQKLLDTSNCANKADALMRPIVTICLQVTLLAVVGIAVLRVQSGALPVDQLVSFLMYMVLIISPLTGAADTVMEMAESLGALQRLTELNSITGTDQAYQAVTTTSCRPSNHKNNSVLVGNIEFQDVAVKYPRSNNDHDCALSDITFSVPAGSWVALTGSSGSGKSTVLSLLEKFIVPTSGCVIVDGVPLFEHDDDNYRRQVGYIEQSFPLFSGTVRDNLLLGRDDITDEQCWEIISQVGLVDAVGSREGGLDFSVGESAYAFSGGERQRLAIARTLIGKPRMLLLDEITSGLDVLNREQVMRLIRTTMAGITTFAAGHGSYGIDMADLVLVLDRGRMVEFGNPREVYKRSALFRSLVAA